MQQLKSKLENCETVAQMLTVLLTEYNVDVRPGPIVKNLIVNGLIQAATMLSIKPKKS